MTFRHLPSITKRRLTRSALSAVLAVAVGAVPVLPGVSLSSVQATTPKWQSGVYTGSCGPDAVNAFGTWRDSPVERTSGYFSAKTWGALATLTGLGTCLHRAGVPVTLSIPMFPSGGGSLLKGSKGGYNTYWTRFGQAAIKNGYAYATIRLGWEMNGTWFKWNAVHDPVHWRVYWQQIVKTLRKVPHQHFTFEWSPALGKNAMADVSKAYPGNAYVTYVGSTVYDQLYGQPNATSAQIWNKLYTEPFGLKWLASFAKAHKKQVAISEWGLASSGSFNGGGGGDDPYFLTHFYSWMQKSNLKYEIYFNRLHKNSGGASSYEHRLTIGTATNSVFKNAAKTYRHLYGGA